MASENAAMVSTDVVRTLRTGLIVFRLTLTGTVPGVTALIRQVRMAIVTVVMANSVVWN